MSSHPKASPLLPISWAWSIVSTYVYTSNKSYKWTERSVSSQRSGISEGLQIWEVLNSLQSRVPYWHYPSHPWSCGGAEYSASPLSSAIRKRSQSEKSLFYCIFILAKLKEQQLNSEQNNELSHHWGFFLSSYKQPVSSYRSNHLLITHLCWRTQFQIIIGPTPNHHLTGLRHRLTLQQPIGGFFSRSTSRSQSGVSSMSRSRWRELWTDQAPWLLVIPILWHGGDETVLGIKGLLCRAEEDTSPIHTA